MILSAGRQLGGEDDGNGWKWLQMGWAFLERNKKSPGFPFWVGSQGGILAIFRRCRSDIFDPAKAILPLCGSDTIFDGGEYSCTKKKKQTRAGARAGLIASSQGEDNGSPPSSRCGTR